MEEQCWESVTVADQTNAQVVVDVSYSLRLLYVRFAFIQAFCITTSCEKCPGFLRTFYLRARWLKDIEEIAHK